MKQVHELSPDNDIDYCSIRLSANDKGDIMMDNDECCKKIVEDAGMEDCNPNKRPMGKELLPKIQQETIDEEFVNEEQKILHH